MNIISDKYIISSFIENFFLYDLEKDYIIIIISL